MAKTRHRSMIGIVERGHVCGQCRSARVVPPGEYVAVGQSSLVIEQYTAPTSPCCGARDADVRHACIYPRAGVQFNQYQPLVHDTSISKPQKRLSNKHSVGDGPPPFNVGRDFTMDITASAGELRSDTLPVYRNEGLLIACRTA